MFQAIMNGIFCLIIPFFVIFLHIPTSGPFGCLSHLQAAPVGQQAGGIALLAELHVSPSPTCPLHQTKSNFGQSIFQFFKMNRKLI